MTFTNFTFYVFLAAGLGVHYLLPARYRWAWLLLSSYIFYAFSDLRFLPVLLGVTLLSYLAGNRIAAAVDERVKKHWMLGGVLGSLAVLFCFRYLGFVFDTLNIALSTLGLHWNIRNVEIFYPLGLSFFALQALSYIWDVYEERTPAEAHFGYFALYMAFFPKLLSGPLERPARFLKQMRAPKPFPYAGVSDHLLRIGWGLFKKIVIADRLAVMADAVFAAPGDFPAPKLVIGVLAFSFQIYLDFSAYTDIALSVAALLGFDLTENFNHPYLATSVADFWRRWHISFSSWLRDYVFLPLEIKDRRRKPRALWMNLHILFTFLVSGLWHGANWTFIVWGGLHGIYQVLEQFTQKARDRVAGLLHLRPESYVLRAWQVLVTFCLVSMAWVFFKADSLAGALNMLRAIFTWQNGATAGAWNLLDKSLGLDAPDTTLTLVALAIFFVMEFLKAKHDLPAAFKRLPIGVRWLIYYGLFFAITILGYYGEVTGADFVYFKF